MAACAALVGLKVDYCMIKIGLRILIKRKIIQEDLIFMIIMVERLY